MFYHRPTISYPRLRESKVVRARSTRNKLLAKHSRSILRSPRQHLLMKMNDCLSRRAKRNICSLSICTYFTFEADHYSKCTPWLWLNIVYQERYQLPLVVAIGVAVRVVWQSYTFQLVCLRYLHTLIFEQQLVPFSWLIPIFNAFSAFSFTRR